MLQFKKNGKMPDLLDMWLRISYPGPVGNNIQAITKKKYMEPELCTNEFQLV